VTRPPFKVRICRVAGPFAPCPRPKQTSPMLLCRSMRSRGCCGEVVTGDENKGALNREVQGKDQECNTDDPKRYDLAVSARAR